MLLPTRQGGCAAIGKQWADFGFLHLAGVRFENVDSIHPNKAMAWLHPMRRAVFAGSLLCLAERGHRAEISSIRSIGARAF